MKLLILLYLFLPPTEWSADYKIQWSDFRERPVNTSTAASTCTELCMNVEVNDDSTYYFDVKAIFHPERSFVSLACSRSQKALDHERLHFDITEIHARHLRALLEPLQNTTNPNNVRVAYKMYDAVKAQWDNAENQYDRESEHSQNEAFQHYWDVLIANELSQTTKYAAQKPILELRYFRKSR